MRTSHPSRPKRLEVGYLVARKVSKWSDLVRGRLRVRVRVRFRVRVRVRLRVTVRVRFRATVRVHQQRRSSMRSFSSWLGLE